MKLSKAWHQLVSYLKFRRKAGNAHGLHSPFVYHLYTEVLSAPKSYYSFKRIEALRRELLDATETISVCDFGAGSGLTTGKKRSIRSIARHSTRSPKLAQVLFRLAAHLNPNHVLEIGTSLGIQTIYFSSALPHAEILTLEGCPETAVHAKRNFEALRLNNIRQKVGEFSSTLPAVLAQARSLGLVLFDGNHRFAPTMEYFEMCQPHTTEDSCFIFDDIHWSGEMEQAWNLICADQRVTISIDCYYFGLIFFRQKQPKQHFDLRV